MILNLNIDLSPRQEEVLSYCDLDSPYRYIVLSTGRQVGKSTVALIAALKWTLQNDGYDVGIYLPVYKQCKNLFRRLERVLEDLVSNDLVELNKTDLSITFFNGSSIKFITADNDNMRGFTFDSIIVDEACFVKDEIYQAGIEPTVSVSLSKKINHGKCFLTSTPKSKNWFYKFVISEDDNTKVIKFTSEEGGIISKEYLDRVRKKIPEAIFKNEYEGEFLDSGNGLFKYLNCIKDIEDKNGHIAGLDVGGKNDYMSLTIMNKQGNVIFQDRWRHQEYEVLLNTVADILKKYNNPLCYIEINGVGQVPFEILRKKYGKVKEWITTNKTKNEIITQLMVDFNTQDLTILDIDYVKDELDNFTCEWKNGKPVYNGANGFHDDSVMSLAICNYHKNRVKNVKPVLIQKRRKRGL